MKEIVLTRGLSAMVDDEDYEFLNQWKWYAHKSKNTFYAHRKIGKYGRLVFMHRLILGIDNTSPELFPDHMDKNGLNNQRYNLRIATRSQNNANKISTNPSGYMGVFPAGKSGWFSRIAKDKKKYYLGFFKEKEDAALAYNKAAKELHGEFANLNQV